VAIWGWGAEGRAAYRAVRHRLPALPLTLLCSAVEAADAASLGDAALRIESRADGEQLAAFDVVIKSPGISPYREEVRAAQAAGTLFVGGTAIWFAENPHARTVCVTGTKGKSTCTALIAHLLRAAGHRTALAGNIGVPLLELLDVTRVPTFWAIELSSFQTGDIVESGVRPEVAVVLNVFPEHLDWHGDEVRYVADKLALVQRARPHIALLNANDTVLKLLEPPDSEVRWFGVPPGWHVRDSHVCTGADSERVLDLRDLPLYGRHNGANLCAAFSAIDALGLDARIIAPHAASFTPLPHRLQWLGVNAGMGFVNDSISTTPHASVAALEAYADKRVAIIVGGHDRGLDWTPFLEHLAVTPPVAVITQGANGPRINALLDAATPRPKCVLAAAHNLEEAIALAKSALEGNGVVLLSPGAPSFDAYRDYAERGGHFARLAGFPAATETEIPGLGVG